MRIRIPEMALVVLIGPTASGKSTFAARHFRPTEVLSSDFFRALVADDEADQAATPDAFDALHYVAAKRLKAGRLTVIDATNVQPESRAPWVALAREHHVLPVAIVFDLPLRLLEERNRAARNLPPHVPRNQQRNLSRSFRGLDREGYHGVWVLRTPEDVDAVEIERERLRPDRRDETGPFDIIGDVHGCADELEALLDRLGYRALEQRPGVGLSSGPVYAHPDGRKAVFLGDLVDRGPRILDVVRIVHNMVAAGSGLCVVGNHDGKFQRALQGRRTQIGHGLAQSLAEVEALPADERERMAADLIAFLDSLPTHYVLDGGRLVVAHAGLKESMHGRASRAVRDFAMYGDVTGESDEYGLPVRLNWAAEYRGKRPWSTATRRWPWRRGRTTPWMSTRGACSAAR